MNKDTVDYSLGVLNDAVTSLSNQKEALEKAINDYETALDILTQNWKTSNGKDMCVELRNFRENELTTFVREVTRLIDRMTVVYRMTSKSDVA